MFQHPLNVIEIDKCLKNSSIEQTNKELQELVYLNLVSTKEGFYFVGDESGKIDRRKQGNIKADKLLPKSFKVARLIHKFPYVEGVGISGSLSKGVLHDDGDFDFFIITQPERLWIARSSLIFFKKLFLFNSRKYFCVNYFIDSNNLEIQEKNLFTATEISTLIPACGTVMNQFFEANTWVNKFFPEIQPKKENLHRRKPLWSQFAMFLLKGRLGHWLDEKLMKLTLKNWNKKFGEFNREKFDLTMKSRKYISKHHPNDFQNKVLHKHQELIAAYKKNHEEKLIKFEIDL